MYLEKLIKKLVKLEIKDIIDEKISRGEVAYIDYNKLDMIIENHYMKLFCLLFGRRE